MGERETDARSVTKTYTGTQVYRTLDLRITTKGGTFATKHTVFVDAPPAVARFNYFNDSEPSTRAYVSRGARVQAFVEAIGTSLPSDDLRLVNVTTGAAVDVSGAVFNWSPNLVTSWNWSTGLPDGNYRETTPARAITDTTGNVSIADATLNFFVLAGDANRDRGSTSPTW